MLSNETLPWYINRFRALPGAAAGGAGAERKFAIWNGLSRLLTQPRSGVTGMAPGPGLLLEGGRGGLRPPPLRGSGMLLLGGGRRDPLYAPNCWHLVKTCGLNAPQHSCASDASCMCFTTLCVTCRTAAHSSSAPGYFDPRRITASPDVGSHVHRLRGVR